MRAAPLWSRRTWFHRAKCGSWWPPAFGRSRRWPSSNPFVQRGASPRLSAVRSAVRNGSECLRPRKPGPTCASCRSRAPSSKVWIPEHVWMLPLMQEISALLGMWPVAFMCQASLCGWIVDTAAVLHVEHSIFVQRIKCCVHLLSPPLLAPAWFSRSRSERSYALTVGWTPHIPDAPTESIWLLRQAALPVGSL